MRTTGNKTEAGIKCKYRYVSENLITVLAYSPSISLAHL